MGAKAPIKHDLSWPVVSLAEIATKIGSGATPKGGADAYLPGRTRFALVRSQNVFDRRFDRNGLAFISDEQADGLRGVVLQPDDILLNITGDGITFGRACMVPRDVLPACVNQHVSIIRLDSRRADAGYVLAFLTHPDVKSYIESFNAGGSRRAITKGHIESFQLPLPPLSEQRAIAHILGTLDDKIELNRRMNETLEAMARALFKSWFIDFDPVRKNAARARNQPSPRSPLPLGEGQRGEGAKHEGEGGRNYRGGYNFSGLLEIARELRRKYTPVEELFWELVRDRQFMGFKFRRQHQLGDYVANFYCHEHRLVIELDGGVHSIKLKKDRKRDAWMEAQGFKVLRIPNERLLTDPVTVFGSIADAILPSPLGRRAGDEGINEGSARPSPSGRGGWGEGVIEGGAFDHLFPDSFEDSELGDIPKGWQCSIVGNHFKLTMGQSPPGSTYNESGDGLPFFQGRTDFGFRFPSRRVFCTAPTRLAEGGDTLVCVRAPVGDVNIAIEPCAIGRGVAAVRHLSGSRSFTYHAMHNLGEHFGKFEGEGTVFGSINKADFERLPFVAPPQAVLDRFERVASPIDDRVESNEGESRTLAVLRDTLLPKLISGELRVTDAERPIETTL